MREYRAGYDLPISVEEYYNLFLKLPNFKERYHKALGDSGKFEIR
jgi:hypothetical protein